MKELQIKVRIYNNRLKERREALRLTQKNMANTVGIPLGIYTALENLSRKPFRIERLCPAPDCRNKYTRGRGWCKQHNTKKEALPPEPRTELVWSAHALGLAEFFDTAVEELFPDAVLQIDNPVLTKKFDGPDDGWLLLEELLDKDSAHRAKMTPTELQVLEIEGGIYEREHEFWAEGKAYIPQDPN